MSQREAGQGGGQAVDQALVRLRMPEGLTVGFLVAGGRVAAALHAVLGASSCHAVLSDGHECDASLVTGADERVDALFLRVDAPPLPMLTLAAPGLVAPGTRLRAVWPAGPGRVQQLPVRVCGLQVVTAAVSLYALDVPAGGVPPGAPLLDGEERVVAMATGGRPPQERLCLGIPAGVLQELARMDEVVPLATFAGAVARGPRVRQVPQHRLEVLEGCSPQQLVKVASALTGAIRVGAPAYNEGDPDTCYQVYAQAARGLLSDVPAGSGLHRALAQGLARAQKMPDADAQAWVMRDAFDGLLDVIARKLGRPAPPSGRPGLPN